MIAMAIREAPSESIEKSEYAVWSYGIRMRWSQASRIAWLSIRVGLILLN
jgi:hypothetical protein